MRSTYLWLLTPSLALFALCFVAPLATMILLAFSGGDPHKNLNQLTSDSFYFEITLETFALGFKVTLAAVLIGYPFAHWIARARSEKLRTLLIGTVMITMMTGIVVRTFAWIAILRDQGVVNSSLMSLGLIKSPLALMYNEFGTAVALVHIYVPFMILTLAGVIAKIDTRLEEAARAHGASPFRAFLEVTLPLSLPGIAAGSLLVFALAVGAYVTPALMGGSQVLTVTMLIYQSVASSFDLGFASMLSIILLATTMLILVTYNRLLQRINGGSL